MEFEINKHEETFFLKGLPNITYGIEFKDLYSLFNIIRDTLEKEGILNFEI